MRKKWIKIEDMRDWLRDYYLENAVDLTDDGGRDLIAIEIYGTSYTGTEEDIDGVIENMSDVEVSEEYVNIKEIK